MGMKISKSLLAPDFFCGMLRFRTREAALFGGASAFVEDSQRIGTARIYKFPQDVEIL